MDSPLVTRASDDAEHFDPDAWYLVEDPTEKRASRQTAAARSRSRSRSRSQPTSSSVPAVNPGVEREQQQEQERLQLREMEAKQALEQQFDVPWFLYVIHFQF